MVCGSGSGLGCLAACRCEPSRGLVRPLRRAGRTLMSTGSARHARSGGLRADAGRGCGGQAASIFGSQVAPLSGPFIVPPGLRAAAQAGAPPAGITNRVGRRYPTLVTASARSSRQGPIPLEPITEALVVDTPRRPRLWWSKPMPAYGCSMVARIPRYALPSGGCGASLKHAVS